MAEANGKKSTPPYVAYPSFRSFIKGLAETHVPDRIDKTVMTKYSGSTQYALLPALQWLGLIDDFGTPQSVMHEITSTDDEEYKTTLLKIIKDKYSFLFNGEFDLAKASSGQVIEAFKRQDISGSTITKCMSFFLVAAKEAGIAVSAHVKAPQAKRTPAAKKPKQANKPDITTKDEDEDLAVQPPEGTEKISFSLRDKPNVVIYFPKGLTVEEAAKVIKATEFNLKMYYGITE
jgi:hypothetical protein